MGKIEEIKKFLEERNVYAKEIKERNNAAAKAYYAYLQQLKMNEQENKKSEEQMKKIMSESFVTDLDSLVSVICENWGVSIEDLRINNYDYTNYGCVSLVDNEGKSVGTTGFSIFNPENSFWHDFSFGSCDGNLVHGQINLPSGLISDKDGLMEVLSDGQFDFYEKRGEYAAKISPNYLKNIFVECRLDDMFAYLGNDVCDYIDNLSEPHMNGDCCSWELFVAACDRYAEKVKTQENSIM